MPAERPSFWTTTAGVLTAVATLLTAVTGAVALYLTTRADPAPPRSTSVAESREPVAVPSTTPTTSAEDELAAWVVEVNALCRDATVPLSEAYLALDAVYREPAPDPVVVGGLLRDLAGRHAALTSQLGSLSLPQHPAATQWLTAYQLETQQVMQASGLWDAGDAQGAGATLFAFSQSAAASALGDPLGIVCP